VKSENVNAFVQGTQSTLTAICGSSGKLGKLFVKQAPYDGLAVSVIIGLMGELTGEVIYTMDMDCGLYLASKVMMDMPVPAMDDMAKSAVSELANMISGSVAGTLSNQGVKVDITTPTFVDSETEGNQFAFVKPGDKLLCVPLHLEGGQSPLLFEIDLHLEG
jgi:chemotaxis protein CheX